MLTFSPEKIVLTGGIVENKNFSIETIDQMIDINYPKAFNRNCPIVKSEVGSNGTLLGIYSHTKNILSK